MTIDRTILVPEDELERRIEAFEAAWGTSGPTDVTSFLPPRESPAFPQVLAELIRIDLEYRWAEGHAPRLESYRGLAPDLFRDSRWVGSLAFEEYRQRRAKGDPVDRDEYGSRYGIDVSAWPEPALPHTEPQPGDAINGFKIISELGRGAFGRVYLAEQTGLAGRKVAIKLSRRVGIAEPEALARLQHTHIVPIYSAEQIGPRQLIVMPFLGRTTLADVLDTFRANKFWPLSGEDLADTVADRATRTSTFEAPDSSSKKPVEHAKPLEQLRSLSWCDAVLWIGWKLADALAHAHERGILHRDVKPANVLLTDDGLPMLLDFNLAAEADSPVAAGGTPAYMAPEELSALKQGRRTPDPRSDLYSLGMVLAELLTGTLPKPGAVHIRQLNPRISPSTEALIRKCLAVSPVERYASARELAEELHRQLTHHPLAVTREPSIRERLHKWKRRHPVLASSGSVAIGATVLIALLIGSLAIRQERLKRLDEERDALSTYAELEKELPGVVEHVTLREEGGSAEIDRLFERYQVTGHATWWESPRVARLPKAQRNELLQQMGELLLLKARREHDREAAIRINQDAERVFEQWRSVPRAVWEDRFNFAVSLRRDAEAKTWHDRVVATPPEARDWYLSGLAARAAGKWPEAEKLFEQATAEDARHYWSWMQLGDLRTKLGRYDRAEGCFDACIALKPGLAAAWYNRGLCWHRLNRYDDAIADFTHVLELESYRAQALLARGLAFKELKRWRSADADFTAAIKAGAPETRVYFDRAAVRAELRDAAGAAADRAQGLERIPKDEVSWITRAREKTAAGDHAGALGDLDEALKFNPRSYSGLMNKANVLDEKLHREAEATAVMDRLVEAHPWALPAWSGRAVLRARLGRAADAKADAEHCLKNDPDAFTRYQLAGVYALLSKSEPGAAATAMDLLRSALRDGSGYPWLPTDADLDPIRKSEEFRKMLEAVRTLAPSK
jgi:serine/threonine protein kinase/tetratricopeptide (TPR) repeat protein